MEDCSPEVLATSILQQRPSIVKTNSMLQKISKQIKDSLIVVFNFFPFSYFKIFRAPYMYCLTPNLSHVFKELLSLFFATLNSFGLCWVSAARWKSLGPHGLQPSRLLRPWDFPGKSTGVGCHCLLHISIYTCF